MNLKSLSILPHDKVLPQNLLLSDNAGQGTTIDVQLPKNLAYTSPYWLTEKGTSGMYKVTDQQKIGKADIIRSLAVVFTIDINGVEIPFERSIVYKFNDPVKGEVYEPLDVIPAVTTRILNKVQLFTSNMQQQVRIKIKAGSDNCKGSLKFELP